MNALSHCNRQTTVPVPSHYSILYTDKLLGVNFVIQTHVLTLSRVVTVIGVGQSLRFFTFLSIVPLRFISASALQSFPVDLIQTHHIKGMIYRTHVWVIKTGTFCNYVRIAETGKKTNTHKTVSVNHVSGIVFPELTQYT